MKTQNQNKDVLNDLSENKCKARKLKNNDSTQFVQHSVLHSNIHSEGIKKHYPTNEYGIAHETMTRQELKAVTRGETLYEAAASILIRRGIWEIVDEASA